MNGGVKVVGPQLHHSQLAMWQVMTKVIVLTLLIYSSRQERRLHFFFFFEKEEMTTLTSQKHDVHKGAIYP